MARYAVCLAEFITALALDRPHVVGLSFDEALAPEFAHRHPTVSRTRVIVSGYTGRAGSLPPEVSEHGAAAHSVLRGRKENHSPRGGGPPARGR